jgi:hypothetical protein
VTNARCGLTADFFRSRRTFARGATVPLRGCEESEISRTFFAYLATSQGGLCLCPKDGAAWNLARHWK